METIAKEKDLQIHVEDTRLFSLFRNGLPTKLTWNELTLTEKEQQIEAQRRAEYCQAFSIYE